MIVCVQLAIVSCVVTRPMLLTSPLSWEMYICVFGSMRRLSCLNNLYDITLIVLPESMNAIIDLLLILAVMSMNRKIGRGVSLNRPPMCWYERRVLTPFVLREMMELVSRLFSVVG